MMKYLRLLLALGGFVVAALSVALDDHRLGWLAIALLLISLLLRLTQRKRAAPADDDPPL
jgi:hypothetical protein